MPRDKHHEVADVVSASEPGGSRKVETTIVEEAAPAEPEFVTTMLDESVEVEEEPTPAYGVADGHFYFVVEGEPQQSVPLDDYDEVRIFVHPRTQKLVASLSSKGQALLDTFPPNMEAAQEALRAVAAYHREVARAKRAAVIARTDGE